MLYIFFFSSLRNNGVFNAFVLTNLQAHEMIRVKEVLVFFLFFFFLRKF